MPTDRPFVVGERVTWLYVPRGGYGYTQCVDAEVVKLWLNRVSIRVQKASGESVVRHVAYKSIRKVSHAPNL